MAILKVGLEWVIIIIIITIIIILKVGTEWVIKGQTCEQSTNATAGIARAIYDRLFKFLIEVRIVISNFFFNDCLLKDLIDVQIVRVSETHPFLRRNATRH